MQMAAIHVCKNEKWEIRAETLLEREGSACDAAKKFDFNCTKEQNSVGEGASSKLKISL